MTLETVRFAENANSLKFWKKTMVILKLFFTKIYTKTDVTYRYMYFHVKLNLVKNAKSSIWKRTDQLVGKKKVMLVEK